MGFSFEFWFEDDEIIRVFAFLRADPSRGLHPNCQNLGMSRAVRLRMTKSFEFLDLSTLIPREGANDKEGGGVKENRPGLI